MEFFSLFSTVFFNIAITFGLLLLIYLFFFSGIRARKDLKPVKYISYKKDHFQENFEFTCEFCGSKVSSADEKCPICGGNFGKNKEYQLKKRAMHQRYLEYMKSQEEAITQETEYISTTMQAIQKYKRYVINTTILKSASLRFINLQVIMNLPVNTVIIR